ncbi:MAG TPA: hypothetical protein VLB04_01485, partial [Methanotrichaceae archaeon]|nr:hypothetical protein [Methanotrichaceae archaeon]
SETVNSDIRRVLAVMQFAFLSCSAIPLSWILWSYGYPSGIKKSFLVEDMAINIPVATVILLGIFIFAFIIPYCYGYLNNKKWIKELRSQQKRWLDSAYEISKEPEASLCLEELRKLKDEIDDKICSDLRLLLIHNLDDTFSCSLTNGCLNRGSKSEFRKKPLYPYLLFNPKDLNHEICKKAKSCVKDQEERDPSSIDAYYSRLFEEKLYALSDDMLNYLNMSLSISRIIEDQITKASDKLNDRVNDPRKLIQKSQEPSKAYKRLSKILDEWISIDEKSRPQMWSNFIAVLITPSLALLLSIAAPWMGIPVDQGTVVKIVSDAASQYTFGF